MSSSDTSSVTQSTENTTNYAYDPQVGNQGSGSSNLNSSLTNPAIYGGTGNAVSITSESPQALAAAASIAQEAIRYASENAQAVANYGQQSEYAARELAKSTTATASEQGTQFILAIGILAVIGLGVYLYARKRG